MDSRKLTRCLFYIYFIVLVWIILFKMQIPFTLVGHGRSINLVPFAGSVVVDGRIYVQEIVYNVLIFIPFGVFSGMLGHSKSAVRQLAPSFFTSLALEILQFLLAVGATDITDLLGNTFGGLIGIGIFYLFAKLCREKVYKVLNGIAVAGAAAMGILFGLLLLAN
ncbi:MAG: VanZ family protein [Eubacterium sp.]|nr:VanZ family protein [Eubacterium sp.]